MGADKLLKRRKPNPATLTVIPTSGAVAVSVFDAKAVCKMCPPDADRRFILPLGITILGQTGEQKSKALGEGLIAHIKAYHMDFLQELSEINGMFPGLLAMNKFVIADKEVIEQQEQMRDRLADLIMEGAPEMPINANSANSEGGDDSEEVLDIECPECGHEFTVDEDGEIVEEEEEEGEEPDGAAEVVEAEVVGDGDDEVVDS